MSIRAGRTRTGRLGKGAVVLAVAAATLLVGEQPAGGQAGQPMLVFGPNRGAAGNVTGPPPNNDLLTNIVGLTVDAVVPGGMDEPTLCGPQETPMNCNLVSPPMSNVTGANLRVVQIVELRDANGLPTTDFVAIGFGKGCLTLGMNSDPMGHCSGIHPTNRGVYTRIYVDGSANGYYNQNWYQIVSQGNTVRLMVAKHCVCNDGNWDYYAYVNGVGGFLTQATGQYNRTQGFSVVGSESANNGIDTLNMTEYYFQNMTARLYGSGAWLSVATMGTIFNQGCFAGWELGPRRLRTTGRC